MGSSNQVRVTLIKETTYGETPGVGDFETARLTSESISGTPETTESEQIRQDRASSGQISTGLTVGGDLNGELAKEDAVDQLMESAMFGTFQTDAPTIVQLDIEATTKKLTRASGDWNADVKKGDILTLTGFANAENNTQVMVAAIDSATVLSVILPSDAITEVGSGDETFKVADNVGIGTTQISFSVEKAFLDLTEKAINYRGMLVNTMSFNVAHGELVTFTFGLQGNDYEPVEASGDFITDGRTINSAATTQSLNGSIDMSFLAEDSAGSFDSAVFCIQSIEITLNNNLNARTCIGKAAPQGYTEGTAQIEVSMEVYVGDSTWNFLSKKLTQTPFALGFIVKNSDGFYGFYLPAIQLTFEDPAIAGANQDVIVTMTGQAKVGASGEKPLTVYKGQLSEAPGLLMCDMCE